MLDRVRRRVESILERFPGMHTTVLRRDNDGFGQPSESAAQVCELTIWKAYTKRLEEITMESSGKQYEDEGMFLACAPYRDALLAIQHGDLFVLDDGKTYEVHNIDNRSGIRVFFQLLEVSAWQG